MGFWERGLLSARQSCKIRAQSLWRFFSAIQNFQPVWGGYFRLWEKKPLIPPIVMWNVVDKCFRANRDRRSRNPSSARKKGTRGRFQTLEYIDCLSIRYLYNSRLAWKTSLWIFVEPPKKDALKVFECDPKPFVQNRFYWNPRKNSSQIGSRLDWTFCSSKLLYGWLPLKIDVKVYYT